MAPLRSLGRRHACPAELLLGRKHTGTRKNCGKVNHPEERKDGKSAGRLRNAARPAPFIARATVLQPTISIELGDLREMENRSLWKPLRHVGQDRQKAQRAAWDQLYHPVEKA